MDKMLHPRALMRSGLKRLEEVKLKLMIEIVLENGDKKKLIIFNNFLMKSILKQWKGWGIYLKVMYY